MDLILYATDYCQLCDQALTLVEQALQGRAYQLQIIDISESDELMAQYAYSIPVLRRLDGAVGELSWPFTSADVLQLAASTPHE